MVNAPAATFCFFSLASCVGLLDKAQAQHTVKVRNGGELGRVIGLVLEHVIQRGDGEGGVEVVVHRGAELLLHRGHGLGVSFAVAGLERGDAVWRALLNAACALSRFSQVKTRLLR